MGFGLNIFVNRVLPVLGEVTVKGRSAVFCPGLGVFSVFKDGAVGFQALGLAFISEHYTCRIGRGATYIQDPFCFTFSQVQAP